MHDTVADHDDDSPETPAGDFGAAFTRALWSPAYGRRCKIGR
jgi:hypothetical protein